MLIMIIFLNNIFSFLCVIRLKLQFKTRMYPPKIIFKKMKLKTRLSLLNNKTFLFSVKNVHYINSKVVLHMKVNELVVIVMDGVSIFDQIIRAMRDNGRTIKPMAKGNYSELMDMFLKGNE